MQVCRQVYVVSAKRGAQALKPLAHTPLICPVRLSVRTTAFQAVKRGSIPLRATN
jgi:hypothetical protein